jgi:hypothetical protein
MIVECKNSINSLWEGDVCLFVYIYREREGSAIHHRDRSVIYHPAQSVTSPTEPTTPPLAERIACINRFECLVAKPD